MITVNVQPNVRIAVEDINPAGGKTILLLHGWPLNRNMFEYSCTCCPNMIIAASSWTCAGSAIPTGLRTGTGTTNWHGMSTPWCEALA